MKILITGSNGQLGLEIIKQLNRDYKEYEVISTDRHNLDITDLEVVINCAAYTAVDLCETDVENAYKINSIGPKNLAIICEKINAIIISTGIVGGIIGFGIYTVVLLIYIFVNKKIISNDIKGILEIIMSK